VGCVIWLGLLGALREEGGGKGSFPQIGSFAGEGEGEGGEMEGAGGSSVAKLGDAHLFRERRKCLEVRFSLESSVCGWQPGRETHEYGSLKRGRIR
jgi:hypothetical protein